MSVIKPQPQPLNPNPSQQTATFTPPPGGAVTVKMLSTNTLASWKTVRIAALAGYKINWVIPGRGGAVSGSQSVWNLDLRVQPVEEIFPSRTARYSLDPYVIVNGRPYVEPTLGTLIKITTGAKSTPAAQMRSVDPLAAPTGLGETARWLPGTSAYTSGVWSPTSVPASPDNAIQWQGSEKNIANINTEFTYALRGDWITTTSMGITNTAFMRLDGMPLFTGSTPYAPVTVILVASITAPNQYWASLLKSVESDGSTDLTITNVDFRVMPDGNVHPFTWGWQYPLPLIGTRHTLSLFGFTLDVATKFLRTFTIDKSLRFSETKFEYGYSKTSKFVLARSEESTYDIDLIDVLMYRGTKTMDQIAAICNVLDAAYGITAPISQDQG